MSDEPTEIDPIPALPLNYFGLHRESWQPMVRMITRLVVLFQVYTLLHYLVQLGCFAWQELGPKYRYQAISGFPLALDVPEMIAHFVILKGALNAGPYLEQGRKWIVTGSMMPLIILPPTQIALGVYYSANWHIAAYGPYYAAYHFSGYLMAAAGGCIWPLFIWRFYRLPEVKILFRKPMAIEQEAP